MSARTPPRRAPVLPSRVAAIALVLAAVLGAAPTANAATSDERFEAANAEFAAGRYAAARDALASLLCAEGASAELLFNLGNASLRAGRVDEAVLAYERALLIAPRDPDVRANLVRAREAAGLDPPDDGAWRRFVRLLSTDAWTWLASGALWLVCAALLVARMRAPQRRTARTVAACAALAVLVAGAAALARLRERDRAVVLASDPVLRVAPYASATASAEPPPGDIVHVERTHGGFTLVRTRQGAAGWIADGSLARVGSGADACAGIAPASAEEPERP